MGCSLSQLKRGMIVNIYSRLRHSNKRLNGGIYADVV